MRPGGQRARWITLASFLFFHRRSTITRLWSAPGANNAPACSHFHNSHAFRLFRASRETSGRPRSYPRSCAPADPLFVLRNITISVDTLLEEAFYKWSKQSKRATIVARSPGANFISLARIVPSASRKNQKSILVLVDKCVYRMRLSYV